MFHTAVRNKRQNILASKYHVLEFWPDNRDHLDKKDRNPQDSSWLVWNTERMFTKKQTLEPHHQALMLQTEDYKYLCQYLQYFLLQ